MTASYPVAGFTGSKDGLTAAQLTALEQLLDRIPGARELHHGDCVGADDAVHRLARARSWRIVVHPPTNQRRACGHFGHVRMPAKDFIARNDDIARACHLLVACPAQQAEQQRSGTWFNRPPGPPVGQADRPGAARRRGAVGAGRSDGRSGVMDSTVTIAVELAEGGGKGASYSRTYPLNLGNPVWHSTEVDQAIEIIRADIRSAIQAVHGRRREAPE